MILTTVCVLALSLQGLAESGKWKVESGKYPSVLRTAPLEGEQKTESGVVVYDSVWREDVKTVQLYRKGAELDFPVLVMGQGGVLVLEFDILRADAEELHWRVAHCDRHWMRDGLAPEEFMTGFAEGTVEEHDFSFTTLKDYVHYRTEVPGGPFSEFTHSGNYILEVFSPDDDTPPSERLLLTRRFCVSEQSVAVRAEVGRPYDGVETDRRQEVDVTVGGRGTDMTANEQWLHVVVQQNGRHDNRRELVTSGRDRGGLAYRQRPQNVFDGGNTFRYFDCSNLRTPMYNVARVEEYGGEQFVLLRPEEDRSRKHYTTETTLAGGMKVNIWDRDNPRLEADYVWVNFSLPMAQPMLDGSVYVVGALTDWRMDSTSRMDYNPKHKAYTKRLLLKQGYYAYQLLVAGPAKKGFSATAPLEGDHHEAPNRYTIYVYQHSPSDMAERLLSVTTAMGG